MREVRTQARIFGTIFRELPLVITAGKAVYLSGYIATRLKQTVIDGYVLRLNLYLYETLRGKSFSV